MKLAPSYTLQTAAGFAFFLLKSQRLVKIFLIGKILFRSEARLVQFWRLAVVTLVRSQNFVRYFDLFSIAHEARFLCMLQKISWFKQFLVFRGGRDLLMSRLGSKMEVRGRFKVLIEWLAFVEWRFRHFWMCSYWNKNNIPFRNRPFWEDQTPPIKILFLIKATNK